MTSLRASTWVCRHTSITPRVSTTHRAISRKTNFVRLASSSTSASEIRSSRDGKPFRMAIIGSGPAGFYTTYRVMSKIPQAKVDMYEALPVPYGLVRFGVAPDHPEVKNCRDKFEEVAASPDFTFIGNATIGGGTTEPGSVVEPTNNFPQSVKISLDRLLAHYDAVVFAYGANWDKKLGVAGEDTLRNIFSAREFVAWYNGLPEYADLNPDLTLGEEVVIVGQGNVALDCTRILLENVDVLRKTDITDAAVETLRKSRIRRVHVVGRRGPMQAAFTIKEARELMSLHDVGFHPIDRNLFPDDISKLPRPKKRLAEVLIKGSTTSVDDGSRSWSLDFALSPSRLDGDAQGNVERMWFERNELSDVTSPDATIIQRDGPSSPEEQVQFGASMVLRSIGYKSLALPGFRERGISFNERKGAIENDGFGRVFRQARHDPSQANEEQQQVHKPGVYCAGWVKRGPTGTIASTMNEAFATADSIAEDWHSGKPFMREDILDHQSGSEVGSQASGWEALKREIDHGAARVVDWRAWQRIDEAERKRGETVGKEREKFTRIDEMLAAAGL